MEEENEKTFFSENPCMGKFIFVAGKNNIH